MALLAPAAKRWRWRRAAALLGVLLLVGCFLVETTESAAPVFSHDVHVVQQSMSCNVCHRPPLGQDTPGMPAPELCQVCHGSLDATKPAERHASRLFAGADPHWGLGRPALDDEILFSHAAHVERADDCADCHRGIERAPSMADVPHLGMDNCTSCHAVEHGSNACATCHRELGVDVAPKSHGADWIQQHGAVFRDRSAAMIDRCDLCHTESACVQCHRSEPPRSHTNTFRMRTHGLEASMDRQGCQTCHTDDSCARCHAVVEPLSHVGPWGQTLNTHCLSCHFPLGNESCVVCHRAAPSHAQATPMPPGHNPAFNCRQCHGNGAPLPHVDDGSSCTACHK